MVLFLGQGHRDAQTFVPKELSEPSLSPPSKAALALATFIMSTAEAIFRSGDSQQIKWALLREKACVVVVSDAD